MGKSQTKKKTAARRHNPMRVPDAHLGQGKIVDGAKEQQMLPVLKKLRSAEYADRTWACAAVCNLIQNDAATRRMFQSKNVVGELIERLSDSIDEVVVEASGALRNLAIDGGHELCGEMFNKGIMSHMAVLMGKISNTITSILASDPTQETKHTDAELQARKHLLSLSENVISLIWCLAEANHKTLAAVNAANVHGLLVKVVEGRKIVGPGVALAAAQALYSLSQDNRPFTSALLQHPTAVPSIVQAIEEDHSITEAELAKREAAKSKRKDKEANGNGNGAAVEEGIPDGRPLLMRVSLAGVLRNIIPVDSPAGEAIEIKRITNDTILPLVNSLLDVDLSAIGARVEQLVNQVTAETRPTAQTKAGKPNKDILVDHRSASELALERIERMLSTVVVGLEVLTGICAGVEDAEELEPEQGGAGAGAVEEDEFVREDDDDEMDGDIDVDAEMEDGIIGGAPLDDDDDEDSDADVLAEAAAHADSMMDNGDDASEDGAFDAEPLSGGHLSSSAALTIPHLLSLSIPSRLIALASLNPLSFPPSSPGTPSIHPPTTAMLSTLHLRALEALNNLLLTIAAGLQQMQRSREGRAQANQLRGQVPLQGVWDGVMQLVGIIAGEGEAKVITERGQEMRGEVLQMGVGCAWGVAKIGADQITISPASLQLLLSLPSLLPTQSPLSLSRHIELLSTLASRRSVSLDENRSIASLLFSLFSSTLRVSSTTPAKSVQLTADQAEVVIALINAIIDIYADETRDYDEVFVKEGCTDKLEGMVKGSQGCVRKVDRKVERRLRGKGEEAVGNLVAFVQYRKKLRR